MRCYELERMSTIVQELTFNRYLVDTNIIIYTLQGLEEVVKVMERLENDNYTVYYSTIIEAELFSFHELTQEQRVKIRSAHVADLFKEIHQKSNSFPLESVVRLNPFRHHL